MLEAALATKRPIHFIHCARNAGVHAFRDWVDELAARIRNCSAFTAMPKRRHQPGCKSSSVLTEERAGTWLPEERDVDAYFLGPKGFMGAIKRHLKALGVPEKQSRYEFFGPAAELN
jgi:nitric oxide dioxygenase